MDFRGRRFFRLSAVQHGQFLAKRSQSYSKPLWPTPLFHENLEASWLSDWSKRGSQMDTDTAPVIGYPTTG